jgi:hypothetical protein
VQNILAGSFGIANLVFKVPPNTKNIYNFESSNNFFFKYIFLKLTVTFSYVLKAIRSSLTSGSASFCTMRFTDSGDNVPCRALMNHNYNYISATTNRFKFYDYAFSGFLCSISKFFYIVI